MDASYSAFKDDHTGTVRTASLASAKYFQPTKEFFLFVESAGAWFKGMTIVDGGAPGTYSDTSTQVIPTGGDGSVGWVSTDGAAAGGGGLVVLTLPEELLSLTLAPSSWTTISSATLSTAGATSALLQVTGLATANSSRSSILATYGLKTTGTGDSSLNNLHKIMELGLNAGATSADLTTYGGTSAVIKLDASQDFDWYAQEITGTDAYVQIYLVGYWV